MFRERNTKYIVKNKAGTRRVDTRLGHLEMVMEINIHDHTGQEMASSKRQCV